MIKLAVCGAAGRMGSRIIALAKLDKAISVKIALERPNLSKETAQIEGIKITDDTDKLSEVDCVIDFSQPQATMEHLKKCVSFKKPMVIGTTGFSEQEVKLIKEASKTIGIVFSPNMSVGVNVVFKALKDLASTLKDYKVKIIEAHHTHKKDAPSGTAKKIAEIVEGASGNKVSGIESVREGEIVGDHEIIFDGEFDKITLKHSAKSRDIFASGALAAAKWVALREKGLFSMEDCITNYEK